MSIPNDADLRGALVVAWVVYAANAQPGALSSTNGLLLGLGR